MQLFLQSLTIFLFSCSERDLATALNLPYLSQRFKWANTEAVTFPTGMNVWSTQATLIEIVNILQHRFANQKELKKHSLNVWAYVNATENVSSYQCLNVTFFFLNKLLLLANLRKDKTPQVREATSPASLVKSNTDQFSFFNPHTCRQS